MTKSFYRFRSTNALLGDFQELEKQEIYFASPQDLNDPLEGFKNLLWLGDDILWSNLLNHYLLCLMLTVDLAVLIGPGETFDRDQVCVLGSAESLPTPQLRERYRRTCEIFFQHEDIARLPGVLATRRSPVRRNELAAYLVFVQPHAFDAVLAASAEHNLMPPRSGDDRHHTGSGCPILLKDMVQAVNASELQHPEEPDIAEIICAACSATAMELDLIDEYGGMSDERRAVLRAVITEFPRRYVSQLDRLLYADWYTACFVESPVHAAMWGNYGDSHRGVCLKFRANLNSNGQPTIKMRQATGRPDGGSSTPTLEDAQHLFREVEYTADFVNLDFFRSLGRLTRPMLDHWWRDGKGNVSPLVADIIANPDDWRKQYWDSFTKAMTMKLADWAHEKEYRLTIDDSFHNFTEPSSRKLQYYFQDLQGLIFGMNTSTTDKVRIMRIVEEKCRKEDRSDFEFYQAYYSPSRGRMEMGRMSLLRFTR